MKRLLIIFLFITFSVSAQKIGADVIKFDSITSTVRNSYDVPYGERWLIWNGTTGEFEYSNGDDVWTTLGGGSTEWGDITGTLSSQTDLQAALNLKANDNVVVKLSGTQDIADTKRFTGSLITGLDGTTNVLNNAILFVPFTGVSYNFTGANAGIISRNRNFMWQSGIFNRTYILNSDNLTAERTYTLPNKGGTFALLDDLDITYKHYTSFLGSGDLNNQVDDGILGVNALLVANTPLGSDTSGDRDQLMTINYNAGEIVTQEYYDVENNKKFIRTRVLGSWAAWKEVTAIGGGTDDQTATEVPFTPYLTIGSTNTQAAVQELKDELDAAVLGGGGLTAEQANRIENIEKIKSFIKTADFLWSPSDVITSTGTTDNAKGSIVTNETGTSIEGEMEDTDVCEGCKIRVRNIGAASEIVNYFADGETGLFRNLAGTTGNEWTVGGSSQFLGTKEAGVITVDGGTVSTRVFGNPELYTVANWLSRVPYETNASTGLNSVEVTLTQETSIIGEGLSGVRVQAGDGAADRMEVPLTLANNTTYIIKVYGAEGLNNLNMNNWVGFTVTNPVWTPNISEANGTTQEFTTTVTTNAASQIMRFYSAGTGGQAVFVDGLSIKEQ